jgi:hypothetical protein
MMSFEQIVEVLESKKVPCVVFQDDRNNITIEFGYNWPEYLVDEVRSVLDDKTYNVVSLCGSEYGSDRVKEATIANGKQEYRGEINKW